MAQRIDTEFALPAHTALQAMFCRAQIASIREHVRIGVVYDLEREEFLMVSLKNGSAAEAGCVRVFDPDLDVGLARDIVVDLIAFDLAGNESVVSS